MLVVIDIGNSNITFGFFRDSKLEYIERIATDKQPGFSNYKKLLGGLFKKRIKDIKNVAISSVVPELDEVFKKTILSILNIKPFFVNTNVKTNIHDLSCKTNELGADRLCDVVGAIEKIGGNKIVVDLGTATKFEAISADNEYLGGAIGPGVGDSFKSLLSHASKLPNLKLTKPKKVVAGWSTQEHLDSGFVFGFASLIDGMVERITSEQKWTGYNVILTGGFSELISPFVNHDHVLDKDLNLFGLMTLWKIND